MLIIQKAQDTLQIMAPVVHQIRYCGVLCLCGVGFVWAWEFVVADPYAVLRLVYYVLVIVCALLN